jgi:hypothetical protein
MAAKKIMKQVEFGEPATLTSTPSGIEIAYHVKPRRAYLVRGYTRGTRVNVDEILDWREVPSVTTVLGCLDKPALPWWGMKMGVEGLVELWERGFVRPAMDGKLAATVGAQWVYANTDNLVGLLTEQKLTVNHVLNKASDRGQGVHDAFEAWAATGTIPNPDAKVSSEGVESDLYSDEEKGYVRGLKQFCEDMGDSWQTDGAEVAVGSIEHGFAGRYDLRGHVVKDVKLVTRATTLAGAPLKRPSDRKTTIIPEGTKGLTDLKTSKGIYGSHLMQLEAYEGGGIECGYDPTDWRAVLHVTKDGLYEFKRARATYENFLDVLRVYRTLESVKEALKS